MAVPGLQGLFGGTGIKEPVSWLTKGVFLLRVAMLRRFVVSDFSQISVKVEHLNVQDIIFLKGIFPWLILIFPLVNINTKTMCNTQAEHASSLL